MNSAIVRTYLDELVRLVETANKPVVVAEPVKVDPKQAAMQSFLDGHDFGCYTEQVTGLVSLLTGLELKAKEPTKEESLVVGQVFIPTTRDSSGHSLTLNLPAVCVRTGGYSFSITDATFTPGGSVYAEETTPATPEQVAGVIAFLKSDAALPLGEAVIKRYGVGGETLPLPNNNWEDCKLPVLCSVAGEPDPTGKDPL